MLDWILEIAVPTCKPWSEVRSLVKEIEATAGCAHRVICTCSAGSASQNRNLALAECTGPIVVMVDDDVEGFPQGWALRLAAGLRDHPDWLMLSARLLRQDGRPGYMLGTGHAPRQQEGYLEVPTRELVTACMVLRNDGTRFDEGYLGSGWEDNHFCADLREKYPTGKFVIDCGVSVVHRNEMKAQRENWEHNKARYQARR